MPRNSLPRVRGTHFKLPLALLRVARVPLPLDIDRFGGLDMLSDNEPEFVPSLRHTRAHKKRLVIRYRCSFGDCHVPRVYER